MKNILTINEAVKKYGEKAIERVVYGGEAEPTNTVIYPAFTPHTANEYEWSTNERIKVVSNVTLTPYWYLTDRDQEDINLFDWWDKVEIEERIDEDWEDEADDDVSHLVPNNK